MLIRILPSRNKKSLEGIWNEHVFHTGRSTYVPTTFSKFVDNIIFLNNSEVSEPVTLS